LTRACTYLHAYIHTYTHTHAQVSIDKVLGISAFDKNKIPETIMTLASAKPDWSKVPAKYATNGQMNVSTVLLEAEGDLNLDMFNAWIVELLKDRGKAIYRFKGILAMQEYEVSYVCVCVYVCMCVCMSVCVYL
jgi:G3E family GTPase